MQQGLHSLGECAPHPIPRQPPHHHHRHHLCDSAGKKNLANNFFFRRPGQESIANRTAAWLVNLTPETPPLPENPPSSAVSFLLSMRFPGRSCANKSLLQSLDTDSENPANMQGGSGTDPIRPRRERYQPPDDSALRGNFIPLSTSLRKRSPSPRREQEPHGVYLQLSLTDSQMDRLTAA